MNIVVYFSEQVLLCAQGTNIQKIAHAISSYNISKLHILAGQHRHRFIEPAYRLRTTGGNLERLNRSGLGHATGRPLSSFRRACRTCTASSTRSLSRQVRSKPARRNWVAKYVIACWPHGACRIPCTV